jgi:arsenate reductase
MNVLFLCTGNSCRSLISEAVFNHLAPAGWHAISAGSQPTGKLNERALALLASKGIPTEGYYSKSWDALPVTPDIVVTVCASAAGETCPAYLGPVLRTHWGVDDPSHVVGSERRNRRRLRASLCDPARPHRSLPGAAAGRTERRPYEAQAELDRIGGIGA